MEKRRRVLALFISISLRNRSLSDARWKMQNWEGKSVFNWKSIKLKRNVMCFRYSQLYVSHVCKRILKFELQFSSYWQNIKFSRYCPKFHIFTNIVIFQVYLQLFRPTSSSLYILWQGHVRNTLFHFCQLPPVKSKFVDWPFYGVFLLSRHLRRHHLHPVIFIFLLIILILIIRYRSLHYVIIILIVKQLFNTNFVLHLSVQLRGDNCMLLAHRP